MGVAVVKYKADISAGALRVPECRVVAGLVLQGSDAKGWQDALVKRNVLQARSPATASRLVQLTLGRLETVDADQWKLV